MSWKEDMRHYWEQYDAYERRRATTAIDDVPMNMSDLTDFVISSDYTGASPIPMIKEVLKKAPLLRRLHIGLRLSWHDICSLDLCHIEELSVNLIDVPGKDRLRAEKLTELSIWGSDDLTPMELMMRPLQHMDYSGMPNLKSLRLCYLQQIDPSDFGFLKGLKSLFIKGWEADNTKWLSEAEYRLQQLYLEGVAVDCQDFVCQQDLERIEIHHSIIANADYLGKLPHLKYLDLKYGNTIVCDGDLHAMGIDKVYTTERDKAIYNIENSIRFILENGVRELKRENARIRKGERYPYAFGNKYFLRNIVTPLEERFIRKAKQQYASDLRAIEGKEFKGRPGISKEAYIATFKEMAVAYFPFLDGYEGTDEVESVPEVYRSTDEIKAILRESGIDIAEYEAYKKGIGEENITTVAVGEHEEAPELYSTAIKNCANTNPAIRLPLGTMQYVRTEDDTILVCFRKKNLMHRMLLERKKALIEDALSKSYGRPMHLKMFLEGDNTNTMTTDLKVVIRAE